MSDILPITEQEWLCGPATHDVLAALTAGGSQVRFVGGCVRDGLLGRQVRDVDIATPDPPAVVMELLMAAGLKAVPTGIDHGTVTAISDHRPYEITTLRRDVETDGRRARVEFTDDWEEDAARRDFTMNALSAEPDGTVHDYFDGLEDLVAGRVRFVGEPAQRINEDVLRILRFYRFAASYGAGPLDLAARSACRDAASKISDLSIERVRDETLKLLAAPHPVPTLRLMRDDAVLDRVIDLPVALDRLDDLRAIDPQVTDPLVRLGVLIAGGSPDEMAGDIEIFARRMRLSNHARKRLVSMVQLARRGLPGADDGRAIRALVYRAGANAVCDAALVYGAQVGIKPDLVHRLCALAAAWTIPKLPVDGADVKALGLSEGEALGAALKAVEDWWIADDFSAGREEALERLRAEVAGNGASLK